MTTTPAVRDPRRRGWGYRLNATLSAVLLGFAAAGCSNPPNPPSSSVEYSPTPAGCNEVNYPLADIPPRAEGEPMMKIPQPPGWNNATGWHPESRFALSNRAFNVNDGVTTAYVYLKPMPSHVSVQEIFDYASSSLISEDGAEIQSITPTTVCGQPAQITEYTRTIKSPKGESQPISGKMLTAVTESEDMTHAVQLSVATAEPDNPTYQRDSQAMLDGFVYLPSAR